MIFVPLTTVTLATISREEMGNATGMFNLLRNIGGSVGIAIAATLLTRYSQFYQNSLVGHITPLNEIFRMKQAAIKSGLMAQGMDAFSAETASLAVIYGIVRRQAGMLSYNRIFFIVGLAFLVIIPLLLLLKKQKIGTSAVEVH
jgi:DHA2 family multidrug resistance protein